MTVIGGRGAWKHYLKTALAACLCFAVLVTGVLYRHDIALYLAEHSWLVDTDAGYEDTQAIDTDALIVPVDTAEGFSLQIYEKGYHVQTGYPTLVVHLTRDGEPIEGISVQYSRVMLSLWDYDVRTWRTKYDVYTSGQPIAAVMAGDLHFPLVGQGAVSTAEGVITIPRDIRGYTGVWCLSLEGLTLVRDDPDSTKDVDLIAEVLTDGTVHALFQSRTSDEGDNTEKPSYQALVTPPPSASEDYKLFLSHTDVKDDTVTLDLVLECPDGKPDGYAVYYETCEIELWNHEKQVWEGKFGTDSVDVPFEKMLMAGDVQFVVDRYSENTYASLSYDLPHDGWYRLTLTGLVLVREAREGEVAEYNLVTETLDEGAVWTVFYKE